MADEKEKTINEEAGLPDNWVPVDVKPIVPMSLDFPGFPVEGSSKLQGSLPPAFQHDSSFVGTAYKTSRLANLALMPLGIQGDPTTNAAVQSTAIKSVATIPSTPVTDVESVAVNLQTGTSYAVQASDNDTLISLSNNSGGTVFLPPSVGTPFAFKQVVFFGVNAGSASTTIINGAGNMMFMQVDTSDGAVNPPTVHDSNGNTWHKITSAGNGGATSVSYWYATNIAGGSNTITVTNFSSAAFCFPVLAEYSGVGAFDQFAPPVIQPNATFLITSFSNEMAIFSASAIAAGTPPTYGATWNGRIVDTVGQLLEDKLVPVSGTNVTSTGAQGSFPSSVQLFAIFSFKVAAIPARPALPKGFFVWIENTGSGNFSIVAGVNIDGSPNPLTLGPNQGALFVFDGFNWYTERGLAPTDTDFYQTVQRAGVSKPQESKLNFSANFTVTDNPGNGSTDIDAVPAIPVVMRVNGIGVATDKEVDINGAKDFATAWGVSINSTPDGG